MRIYNAKNIRVFINGVQLDGFGDQVVEPVYSADQAVAVAVHTYVPFDSVSQAERRRMESDARLRAEERLREWRRSR